jgi:cytochrome c-type biogenesis protein CcmH/NrfF
LLDEGRTRDQVIQYFIEKYGGQVALAAPIDKGFNRLAWLFPYSLGAAAIGGLGYAAFRMSRRTSSGASKSAAEPQAPSSAADPELSDKLDDELRNLD